MFQSITGVVTDVTKPSGEKLTYTFESMYYCSQSKEECRRTDLHRAFLCLSGVVRSEQLGIQADIRQCGAEHGSHRHLRYRLGSVGHYLWRIADEYGGARRNQSLHGDEFQSVVPHLYLTVTDPMGRATTYRQDNTGLVRIKETGQQHGRRANRLFRRTRECNYYSGRDHKLFVLRFGRLPLCDGHPARCRRDQLYVRHCLAADDVEDRSAQPDDQLAI